MHMSNHYFPSFPLGGRDYRPYSKPLPSVVERTFGTCTHLKRWHPPRGKMKTGPFVAHLPSLPLVPARQKGHPLGSIRFVTAMVEIVETVKIGWNPCMTKHTGQQFVSIRRPPFDTPPPSPPALLLFGGGLLPPPAAKTLPPADIYIMSYHTLICINNAESAGKRRTQLKICCLFSTEILGPRVIVCILCVQCVFGFVMCLCLQKTQ